MHRTLFKTLALAASLSVVCAVPAQALLMGDEVSVQRVFDSPFPDFDAVLDEATVVVGPGSEFQTPSLDFDFDDSSVTISTIVDTAFGNTMPHEIRVFVSPRIVGFSLTNTSFGTLSDADISFSDHLLRVNVSGLDPDFPGSAEIQLILEPTLNNCPPAVPAVSPLGLGLLAVVLAGAGFWFLRRIG